MGRFEAEDLVIETKILEGAGQGAILEISFTGIHHHHWPGGAGPRIQAFMESEIRAAHPAACLFDFLGYEYTFGNEIAAPMMAPLVYCGFPPPPIAIVAAGRTGRSLRSLIDDGNLNKILYFFEDAENGRAFLRQALEKRGKPPPAD